MWRRAEGEKEMTAPLPSDIGAFGCQNDNVARNRVSALAKGLALA